MLEDNPIGLMAFVGEKFHEASSPSVHDDRKWQDHILTTVCLYYFTNCITSSAMIYYNNTPHHEFASYAEKEENQIKCPFAYTSYAYDTAPNSKRAVERTGNLVLYRERDHAGHFAALEDPHGVVEDVRELVGKVWKR
jgi:pimeloyl-ACP methyl ester carboxylesterase